MAASPTKGLPEPEPSTPPPNAMTPPGETPPVPMTSPTIDEVDLYATLSSASVPECSVPFDPRAPVLPSRFGAYILESRIDEGGMGVVYKARQLFNPSQPAMSRVVALKMILLEKLSSPQAVKRFLAEAHSAARLEYHPNIVQIHDVGEVDGMPYFSMQFIGGGSLQDIVDERHILPPKISARVVRKVADA